MVVWLAYFHWPSGLCDTGQHGNNKVLHKLFTLDPPCPTPITPERIKEAFRVSHLTYQVNRWCTPVIQALPKCKSRLPKIACIQCLQSGSVLMTMLLIELCTIKCIQQEAGDCYKNDVNVLWKLFCAGKVGVKPPERWGTRERAQLLKSSMLLASFIVVYFRIHMHTHKLAFVY